LPFWWAVQPLQMRGVATKWQQARRATPNDAGGSPLYGHHPGSTAPDLGDLCASRASLPWRVAARHVVSGSLRIAWRTGSVRSNPIRKLIMVAFSSWWPWRQCTPLSDRGLQVGAERALGGLYRQLAAGALAATRAAHPLAAMLDYPAPKDHRQLLDLLAHRLVHREALALGWPAWTQEPRSETFRRQGRFAIYVIWASGLQARRAYPRLGELTGSWLDPRGPAL